MRRRLTPRAYACKPDSPAGGGIPALRDSNSSLRDWLHGDSSGQEGAGSPGGWEERQEQDQVFRGLGSTVAALEAAAAEAAEAARQLKQQHDKAQAMRRPSLPPLDVAAAAAVAAAEQDSGGRGAYAASPLSSPGSSYGSPGGAGYCSSSTYLSSASSPAQCSPARYRLTPTRLQHSSVANPLFDQPAASPAAASQAAGAPTGAPPKPEVAGASADAAESGTCGSSRSSATEAVRPFTGVLQRSPVRHLEQEEDEEEEEAAYLRGSFGGGSDLLESLLSPPHMKPVHTQLLGALMHTRTSAVSANKPVQQAVQHAAHAEQAEQPSEEGGEEEPAAPAAAAAEGAGAAPVEPPAQGEPCPAEQAAEPVAMVEPAAAGPATPALGRSGGGSRKLVLLLLGAAAGAAAALLAQQQGGSARSRASGPPTRKERGGQKSSSSGNEDQHRALTMG